MTGVGLLVVLFLFDLCMGFINAVPVGGEMTEELTQRRNTSNTKGPQFTTKGKSYQLVTGETLELPCVVDHLGSYVILWRRRNVVLTAQNLMVARDPRYSLVNGFNLQITSIEPKDAGDYSCQIADDKPRAVVHNVEVLVPPSIQSPQNNQLITKKGGNITLECKASGNPMPNVHWTRKENPENFHQKIEGFSVTLEKVDLYHAGTYRCTAANGVGSPVSQDLKLNVLFAPEIVEAPTWIHTTEGLTVEMECLIKGVPEPQVTWYQDKMLLNNSIQRYHMSNTGSGHKLVISDIQMSDFGNFSCVAENSLGLSKRFWLISGNPGRADFRSSPYSPYTNSYNLSWVSQSFTPIDEIRLLYRKLLINESYQSPGTWQEIIINNTLKDEAETMTYNIDCLQPASVFQAIVQTRNHYGWSDISDLYQFYTRSLSNELYEQNILDLGLTASFSPVHFIQLSVLHILVWICLFL